MLSNILLKTKECWNGLNLDWGGQMVYLYCIIHQGETAL